VKHVRSSSLPITIGVSTRALFDLEEEHAVFVKEGVAAYTELQRKREGDLLKTGTAFEVVRRLLALNDDNRKLIDVIVLSQNSPDLSLRAFSSFEHYKLPIKRGSFTSGRPVAPFVGAWNIDLFLSNGEGADANGPLWQFPAQACSGSRNLHGWQGSKPGQDHVGDGEKRSRTCPRHPHAPRMGHARR
jgi:hypothetical protein